MGVIAMRSINAVGDFFPEKDPDNGIIIYYWCCPNHGMFVMNQHSNYCNPMAWQGEEGRKIADILSRASRDILEVYKKNKTHADAKPKEKQHNGVIDRSQEKVFLICRSEEPFRHQVARFLEKLGLIPIVLVEQPGEGRTFIEKLEDYSDIAHAVVLSTPDDLGRTTKGGSTLHSTTQNIIFELGYFLGKCGRGKVSVLCDKNVEFPSNYSGVECIELNNGENWKLKLAGELRKSGLSIDLNAVVD
jgi:predicted nucleotide-binding protein